MNNPKKSDTWKIKVTIATNFISSKDNDGERVIHSKSDNIEITINEKADELIEKRVKVPLNRYHIGLQTLTRGSDFIFECVQLWYYKCHKINFKQGVKYIDSPDWIKYNKAKINPINKKDNACLQLAVIVTLDHEQIKKIRKK